MYWSDIKFSSSQGLGEWCSNLLHYFHLKRHPVPDPSVRLDGQTCIVTGSNRSIGKAIVEHLASRGARVILACRSGTAAEAAILDIHSRHPDADLVSYPLDLASFASIRAFTSMIRRKESRIDVLINNAGVFCYTRMETREGFEMMIGVNYFAPAFLTLLLLDMMRASSPDPRVICVASMGHCLAHDINWQDLAYNHSFPSSVCHVRKAWLTYAHSKLAITLFCKELARRAEGQGIRVFAVDPGISPTELVTRDMNSFAKNLIHLLMPKPIFRSISEAAASVIHAVIQPRQVYSCEKFYLRDGIEKEVSLAAQSGHKAERLWAMMTQVLQSVTDPSR